MTNKEFVNQLALKLMGNDALVKELKWEISVLKAKIIKLEKPKEKLT